MLTNKKDYTNPQIKTGVVILTPRTKIDALCCKVIDGKRQYFIRKVDGYPCMQYDFDFDVYLQKTGRKYEATIGGRYTGLQYRTLQDFCDNILDDLAKWTLVQKEIAKIASKLVTRLYLEYGKNSISEKEYSRLYKEIESEVK